MHSVDLRGEVAVVTGASGRLGTVFANCLLEAGADVVGLDTQAKPNPMVEQVATSAATGRYLHLCADVTDRASLAMSLVACQDRIAVPSVIVNNAGVDQPPSSEGRSWRFEDIPEKLSAHVLDVNALGVLRVCQVYGAALVRRQRGSVINIGSLYGTVAPDPRLYAHLPITPLFLKPPAYGMSKAGVCALTRYLAALWGRSGVRVNTLSPGGILGDQDELFRTKFAAQVPLRRMASLEELTGPLLFLASGLSSYVSGHDLIVDGGYTCW